MKPRHFLSRLDHDQITSAIATAEKGTSGEIRVFISRHRFPDALPIAQKHFRALGMFKTRHRNAILIFVAPKSQTFALVGDTAIHKKCGDTFWQALRDEMIPRFKSGQFTAAIVHAITKAGELLAAHFPPDAEPKNELPDTVEED